LRLGVITTEAMDELCALMEQRRLCPEAFAHWVTRHSDLLWVEAHPQFQAEPCSQESARRRVRQFDAFLMQPGVEPCRFTRAIIAMRNVFARHAGLALSGTVSLRSD
jgi:hypothetical protein